MRLRLIVPLAASAVVLAACGGGSSSPGSSGKNDHGGGYTGTGALAGASVSGGAKPSMKIVKKPLSVTKTTAQVVSAGHGATVKKGQNVRLNYVVVDGRTGKRADTTYGKKPVVFTAAPGQVLPGIAKGLVGQRVGSRVLVGIPPADGFGAQGNSQLGVKGSDTLVFLFDIKQAHTPLARVTGRSIAPEPGAPQVRAAANGQPTITVPKNAPPKKLLVQPLVAGTGSKVGSGQTITAQYVGVLWRNGKVIDSTWQRGGTADFPVGVGQVIPGWDKGLVGQRVGSRVLLVVPPADAYPHGSSDGSIKSTDTLVFVVDILDAM